MSSTSYIPSTSESPVSLNSYLIPLVPETTPNFDPNKIYISQYRRRISQTILMDYLPEEPALDPPPGMVPNFADPGGSQAIGYGIVISSSIISFIAVLARLVTSSATKKFVVEDFLMIAALVCNGPLKPCSLNQSV